jgi:hypothetical protein
VYPESVNWYIDINGGNVYLVCAKGLKYRLVTTQEGHPIGRLVTTLLPARDLPIGVAICLIASAAKQPTYPQGVLEPSDFCCDIAA